MDNNIVARNPVDWRSDAVLVTGLERVDDAEDLGGVAASGRWVGHDEADGLLGVNDENGADGERNALGVNVGRILVIDPIIRCQLGAFAICQNGEKELWNTHMS